MTDHSDLLQCNPTKQRHPRIAIIFFWVAGVLTGTWTICLAWLAMSFVLSIGRGEIAVAQLAARPVAIQQVKHTGSSAIPVRTLRASAFNNQGAHGNPHETTDLLGCR